MHFQDHIKKKVVPQLAQKLQVKNALAVPRIEKIKVSIGIGSAVAQNKDYALFTETLRAITGQTPIVHRAKKAISNFKLKEKMPVGLTVTLRGKRMYDFFYKLVNVVLPRVRDFQGIRKQSLDGHGNISIGFKEHTVFPEINPDQVTSMHGVQITVVTNAKNNETAETLLAALGFPFARPKGTRQNRELETPQIINNA